jgi:hypothetical protein
MSTQMSHVWERSSPSLRPVAVAACFRNPLCAHSGSRTLLHLPCRQQRSRACARRGSRGATSLLTKDQPQVPDNCIPNPDRASTSFGQQKSLGPAALEGWIVAFSGLTYVPTEYALLSIALRTPLAAHRLLCDFGAGAICSVTKERVPSDGSCTRVGGNLGETRAVSDPDWRLSEEAPAPGSPDSQVFQG